MLLLLIRTTIIYVFLLITMRLMGKRQLGELEISELVSTLLLSNIASLPITNPEIPMAFALVPILTISFFEITSSLLLTKIPQLKRVLSTRPSVIIRKGKIDRGELLKNRISVDELMSELRQSGTTSIQEVQYAIIEQNGKMTVIPKADYAPPTRNDLKIAVKDSGLCHIIISDGTVNRNGLLDTGKSQAWLDSILSERKLSVKNIFLMTLDDADNIQIIKNSQIINQKKKAV